MQHPKKCRSVGYSLEKNGYRVYDIKKDIIEIHRDEKFIESQFCNLAYQEHLAEKLIYQFSSQLECEEEIQQERHDND